ncbi:hypothetical protein [Porphyromonas gulae]
MSRAGTKKFRNHVFCNHSFLFHWDESEFPPRFGYELLL